MDQNIYTFIGQKAFSFNIYSLCDDVTNNKLDDILPVTGLTETGAPQKRICYILSSLLQGQRF